MFVKCWPPVRCCCFRLSQKRHDQSPERVSSFQRDQLHSRQLPSIFLLVVR